MEKISKENQQKITDWINGYVTRANNTDLTNFVFEHFLVAYETVSGCVTRQIVQSRERANALAYAENGCFYLVGQDKNGKVTAIKQRVTKDRNVLRM